MSRTLVNLAVLRALYEEKGCDKVQPFVPLVMAALLDSGIEQLDPDGHAALCDWFEEEYGLRIPQHAMMTIVRRAVREGYVAANGPGFTPIPARIADIPFVRIREEQKALWAATLISFVRFTADMGSPLSEAQADRALLSVLKERDCEIVAGSTDNSMLAALDASDHEYLASCFVTWAYEADPKSFEFVVSFAVGHMLAGAVLNWDLQDYVGGFPGLYVYLDAPILLRLAGITIPARQAATVELLELLDSLGVVLLIFDHSVQEAVTLLESAYDWVDNVRYDPLRASQTARYVVDNGWSRGQLDDAIARLPRVLEEAKIVQRPAPGANALTDFNIDELALEKLIVQEYRDTNRTFNYAAVKPTILLDIKSIGAIYKLRKGRQATSLADARYVFVTLNGQLAKIVTEHGRETEEYQHRTIPACVSEVFLGTLAWIAAPSQGMEVNARRVVADCMAALQPSPALVARMLTELRVMHERDEITSELYNAVRVDPTARRSLVEMTHNDVMEFKAQTARELIREYQKGHERQVLEGFNDEREMHKETASQLSDTNAHLEKVAKWLGTAIGGLAFLAASGVLVYLLGQSGQANKFATAVTVACQITGFGSAAFSLKAKGYAYRWALRVLMPEKTD